MTAKQIEIGDKLLKYLQEKGGSADSDQYYHLLNQEGYDSYKDVIPTLKVLYTYGFITDPTYDISLTVEGHEVAKKGLDRYFKRKDYAVEHPRKGWDKVFKKMHKNGEDLLLLDDVFGEESIEEWK